MSSSAPTPTPTPAPVAKKPKSKSKKQKLHPRSGERLICRNDVIRLSRRAGVLRISGAVVHAVRKVAKDDIEHVLRLVSGLVNTNKRSTVNLEDIKCAFKHLGQPVYA